MTITQETQKQTILTLWRAEWTPVGAIKERAAREIAALFRAMFPSWAEKCGARIDRAARIIATAGACKRGDAPGVFLVRSEHNPRGFYVVDMLSRSCTCPDAGTHQLCKHRLAIGFHLFGHEWTDKAIRKQLAAFSDARQEMDAAWKRANDAATVYENFPPDQFETNACQQARARMIELTEAAGKAHDHFNDLSNWSLARFV